VTQAEYYFAQVCSKILQGYLKDTQSCYHARNRSPSKNVIKRDASGRKDMLSCCKCLFK